MSPYANGFEGGQVIYVCVRFCLLLAVITSFTFASDQWPRYDCLWLSGSVKNDNNGFVFNIYITPIGKGERTCNILFLDFEKHPYAQWQRNQVKSARVHGNSLLLYTDLGIFTFNMKLQGTFCSEDRHNIQCFEYMKKVIY